MFTKDGRVNNSVAKPKVGRNARRIGIVALALAGALFCELALLGKGRGLWGWEYHLGLLTLATGQAAIAATAFLSLIALFATKGSCRQDGLIGIVYALISLSALILMLSRMHLRPFVT